MQGAHRVDQVELAVDTGQSEDGTSQPARLNHLDSTALVQKPVEASGDVRSAISDGLVGLLKEYYGRGPDQARTYLAQDLVVCAAPRRLHPVEQTLLAGGRGEDVIRQRIAFQDVMRERFERVVEEATGRQVVGFMSGNQQDPDMICEVFVLAPNDVMH